MNAGRSSRRDAEALPSGRSGEAPLSASVGFWLGLGLLSTAFAEVVTGSSPFPFVTAWGLAVVLPLYTLHAVVLAAVVHRYAGGMRFYPLFVAGALFGLYEAYLTKVLWQPTWDPLPFQLGGVYVFETVLLVLFWHPIASFVLPLVVAEGLLTRTRSTVAGLPEPVRRALASSRTRRRTWLALAVGAGLVQGGLASSPLVALGSNLVAIAVVGAFVAGWRARVGANRYGIGELLPRGRRFTALVGCLALLYVVLGATLRVDVLPPLTRQLPVLAAYVGLLVLLRAGLRRARRAHRGRRTWTASNAIGSSATARDGRTVAIAVSALVLTSAASSGLLGPVRFVSVVGLFLVALVVGPLLLVLAIRDAADLGAKRTDESRRVGDRNE